MDLNYYIIFDSSYNMWSVVVFEDDSSIEAVPSSWFFNNKCAWPTKNAKKCIEKRVKPNKTDFIYLKARKIGRDVGK